MKAEVGEQAFDWRLAKLKFRLQDFNKQYESSSSNEKVSLFVNDQLTYLSGLKAQHEDSMPPVLLAEAKELRSDLDVNQRKPRPAILPDLSKADPPEQEEEITETQIHDAYKCFFPPLKFDSFKESLDKFAAEVDVANKNEISGQISRGAFLNLLNRFENRIIGIGEQASAQRDLRESFTSVEEKRLLKQIRNLDPYWNELRIRILDEVIDKRKEDMRAFLQPYRELLQNYKLGWVPELG